MIFNTDILFIHIGKTGGMSCVEYLLNNLRPTIYNCHTESRKDVIKNQPEYVEAVTALNRHCPLPEEEDRGPIIDNSFMDYSLIGL
jgi:hypothetical protein